MRAKCFSFVGSSVAFFCRVGGVNSCDKEPRHVCVLLYFARRVLILAALSPRRALGGILFPFLSSLFPSSPLSSLFPSSPLSVLLPSSPLPPPPLVPLTLPVVFPSCFLQLVSYSCDGEEVAEKRKLRRKKGDKESGAWSLKGILGCLLSAVRCRPRIFCSLAAVPSCVLIFYSLLCSRFNEDGDGGKRRYFADDGEGRERVGCSRQRGEGLGGVSREGLSRRAVNADSWAAITVHSGKGEGRKPSSWSS